VIDRRNFIKAGVAAACGGALWPFVPQARAAGGAYELIAAAGEVRIEDGQQAPTRVMHYNQSIPGPLLRIPQGRESVIRFRNQLDEPSTVHWHGMRIDNAMDGVPGMTQAPVAPGEEFEYRLTPPDAGTYWYHSHLRSWFQQDMGLAGVLIVDEAEPPRVDRDLVLAIDDWRFDEAMQMDTASFGSMHDWAHGGRLGNYLTANGKPEETFAVASGERVRLRLVNTANARIMNLLLEEPQLSIVALDGQPVAPHEPDGGRIRLAPGQRCDLIVDLVGDPGQRSRIEVVVGEYAYEIARFAYGPEVRRQQLLDSPIALPDNPLNRLRLPGDFVNVTMVMEGGAMGGMRGAKYQGREMDIRELVKLGKAWSINGIVDLPDEPLIRVERGTAVSLHMVNDNAWPHAMHVHGHHFIDDRNPGAWRDTSLLARGETRTLRFVADNPGKWLIHCHMAEHMAAGMVTWFEVT